MMGRRIRGREIKMNKYFGALTVVVALMAAGGSAYATKMEVLVKADNKADFPDITAALKKNMEPGGRYESITAGERDSVNKGLADMQSLLDKYDTVALMPQPARVQLFNDQETVNAALTKRDDDRLICESESSVGSHIPRTTCQTYREVQIKKGNDQYFRDQISRVPTMSGQSLPGARNGG